MKKILTIWICMLFTVLSLSAQDMNDAVIYIQSDKETPIYVKLEGQMMERYSKHYVVLHSLASGPTNVEILFQQSKYPNQQFVLNVPPSGQRSLVLKKINEQTFALYDLNYGVYLQAGNTAADDIDISKPQAIAQQNVIANEKTPVKKSDIVEDKVQEEKPNKKKKKENDIPDFPVAKTEKVKEKKEKELDTTEDQSVAVTATPKKRREERKAENSASANKEDDRFLTFEMDKKEKQSSNTESKNNKNTAKSSSNSKTKCDEPASEAQLNNFASLVNSTDDEERKLVLVRKNADKYCFSTDQIRTIAMNFDSQSSRYEVARALKSSVVDVENYAKLNSLFNTNYLRERFKNEVVDK